MTATLAPPSSAGAEGGIHPGPSRQLPPAPRFEPVVALVLGALTLVAVPGIRGVLGSAHSLGAVLVAAFLMHLIPAACRIVRRQAEFVVSLVTFIVLLTWLSLANTTVLGIPTSDTWDAAVNGLRGALAALDDSVDPAVSEPAVVVQGRLVLAVFAVLACAWMADQASFRVRSAFLALVPSFSLVLIGAARAPAANRGFALALYLTAALAFLLAHHLMVTTESTLVVGGRTPWDLARVLPAGVVLTAVVLTGALVAGPRLPGYGKKPIVNVAGSQTPHLPEPDSRTGLALSPLVDVNPTLVERPNVELFTVLSPAPSYWRLTSLDDFDGQVWSSSQRLRESPVDPPVLSVSAFETVTQVVEIQGLRGEWLPAAYRPQWVSFGEARLDRGASESLVPQDTVRTGVRYEVGSSIPRPTPELLEQVARPVTDAGLRRYLAIPPDVSPRVREETLRVTREASADGPYAQARALQDYFRRNFTYDLKVPTAHDDDALERFLFRSRRGYCEQFAAAYAVMARFAGLPSRVAVGFTPGELADDGRYHVRGLNAHAWPEVFLTGAGWVAFEPTPGRGMPGAETYTGVPAAQEGPPPGPSEPVPVTTEPTVAPTTAPGEPVATTDVTPPAAPPSTAPTPVGGGSTGPGGGMGLAAAGATVAGLALIAGMVPIGKRIGRRLRWSRAVSPNELALLAWAEAEAALAGGGLGRKPAETLLGHAARITGDQRLPETLRDPVLRLAGTAGTASYSGRALDPAVAAQCREAARSIESKMRSATPLLNRLLRTFDLRSAVRGMGRSPRRRPVKRRRGGGGQASPGRPWIRTH